MRRRFLILLFCSMFLAVCGQKHVSFTHYSSEDGLSQNTVRCILQDRIGNMWFGTWDGLNKFDGYTFKAYKAQLENQVGLTNNRIEGISEDAFGFLWVMTYDNRVYRFDPKTETFEPVKALVRGQELNIASVKQLRDSTIWLLSEKVGAIRVRTNPETFKFTTDVYAASEFSSDSDRHVNSLFCDALGCEWLLTDNGLCAIQNNGEKTSSYFDNVNAQNTNRNQSFYCFCEYSGTLFFGSDSGRVWCRRHIDGHFNLVDFAVSSPIVSIDSISKSELLVTTATEGFFVYDYEKKESVHYSFGTLLAEPVKSVYVDRSSIAWFEQDVAGRIVYFDTSTRQVKHHQMEIERGQAYRSEPSFLVIEESSGRLWINPYGGGFCYYDREKDVFEPFFNMAGSSDWRFSNKLHTGYSDKQGNLWLCTHSKGLEKISFQDTLFHVISPVPHEYESLNNDVRSLFEDRDGLLWVGVKDGLLRVYNKQHNYIGYLTEDGRIAQSGVSMSGVIYCMTQDNNGIIWIGTKGEGLVRVEKVGERYQLKYYKNDEKDIYSISDNNIYSIHEDSRGKLWIATYGGGLNLVETGEDGRLIFVNHRNNLKGYPIDVCDKVRFVTSDNDGHIWVGTTTGALSFDEQFSNPENIVFHHHMRIPGSVHSLSNNDVHWIITTSTNDTYLATFGGGLNKLISLDNDGKAEFQSYTTKDGLLSDVLLSIREDNRGNLWISMENGVCKFSPADSSLENYDERSLSMRARFNEAASVRTYDGLLWFGISDGLFYFNPDSVRKSTYIPQIVLSRLVVGNEEIKPSKNGILPVILDYTKKLVLSHKENVFTIHFAALDYKNSENVQYAYKLEGFENEWIYVDKRRTATYTNLQKGNYVFKVKSTNSEGVWVDNERSMEIEILPSFWETPLAYLLYVLAIFLVIFIAVYILFTIYRLKHEVSIEQQISNIKLRFFTDISHELRTPLTLISGPVELVLKNKSLPDDARTQLQVVERNVNRMLRLVNQILDFRKIQNKKMKMRVQMINIVPFIHRIMESFESMAEEHRIDFIFETEKDALYLWVDADKFEKIVFNLLSNAFKYTPPGKMISIFVHEEENIVSVGVKDQGIGIEENKRSSIFERFENRVGSSLFNQSSTGIGLSLVRELVEMHKAKITVESKVGEGSCFKVDFLKGKDHYDSTVEFVLEDVSEPVYFEKITDEAPTDPVAVDVAAGNVPADTLLLIEDNVELRRFLRDMFKDSFRVVEAVDGMEGWNKALKFVPDLIISDVMMPEKDGISLTKELKKNMTTSHIPVILLTAKSAMENKLEGLECGADDYITKPFSATYLEARVENLLSQRRKLQELYRNRIMGAQPSEIPEAVGSNSSEVVSEQVSTESSSKNIPQISISDATFLQRLEVLMEKNLDNGELMVEDLAKELAVSRSVFFKKLKALTGLAPIEFIREVRVKRAAQYIDSGEYTIAQVSDMVGINDPRYFSKCFKRAYGMTPTEYKEQNFHKKEQNVHKDV